MIFQINKLLIQWKNGSMNFYKVVIRKWVNYNILNKVIAIAANKSDLISDNSFD